LRTIAPIIGTFQNAAQALSAVCATSYPDKVQQAIDLLVERLSEGNKLLVCGNGGSAADAMHIAAELVGRFLRDRRPLPALALSANPAILTALSNDYSYESVFSRQVEALAVAGDVVWGISTSGNSRNVVEALRSARALGAWTIGMTGEAGGAVGEHSDVLLAAPVSATPRIQEIHLVTYHVICEAVEAAVSTPVAVAADLPER
jgi:D-sedoheptulose 7-phosphate isomerase